MAQKTVNWLVLIQTQTQTFQRMLEALIPVMGEALLVTGTPYPTETTGLAIKAAPAYDRRELAHRALSWARYLGVAGWHAIGLRGRPHVFVVTNPPFLPHLAWLLHRVRGFPYALLIWDIYPNHLVQQGILRDDHWVTRSWIRLNQQAMTEAEVVITLSHSMAETLRAQLGPIPKPCNIEVIPMWTDTEWIKPMPKAQNSFAAEHGQVDKVTVLYSGNMGAGFGLTHVVEAARYLKDDPRIAFLMIGDGMERATLENMINKERLTNVTLLPLQPWDQLPYTLTTGDIALVMQAPGSEHLMLPSKTYFSLAAGSALLACTSMDSYLATLVRTHALGAVCRQGDINGLVSAILALVNDPAHLAECRGRSRRIAVERYGVSAAIAEFKRVLGATADA